MSNADARTEFLVSIRGLHVSFSRREGEAQALRGLDLDIPRAGIRALVGESGSGKSVTARTIIGLIGRGRRSGVDVSGSIRFEGVELIGLQEQKMRHIRGNQIAMIFQEPAKHLNPALRIGEQIVEMLRLHRGMSRPDGFKRAEELLELVGLEKGKRILHGYPHELSGGMQQRAMIAMAISCEPKLLIADEPTTALDVTIQRQIVDLLLELRNELGMAVLFISHDLGVVHEIAEHVSVIYCGRIVESAPKEVIFGRQQHPYTKLLLASIPDPDRRGHRLPAIPGRVPDAEHIPDGCSFHPRCPFAESVCSHELPELRVRGEGTGRQRSACHFVGCKELAVPSLDVPSTGDSV